jgi:protocatechuate 3,4-dioxygenase beta subunit
MSVFLAALLALAQQPAAAAQQPTAPATATLRGHVTGADNGRPLRKAQVRIMAGEIRENRLAITDADGRYEFKEVKAGRYTISASKTSYVSLSYGQTRPFETGTPLEIKDGQTVERVDITLPRGGVMMGRILDEFGEPLSDVQVAAMRYQFMQGRRQLTNAGRFASSDDMGEFRLYGLQPGQYYLQATWRANRPVGTVEADQTAYAPTFFPGVPDAAQAQRFTIGIGQELSDLVMSLKPVKATHVTGTVLTSEGRPMTGMLMVMQMTNGGFAGSTGSSIRPDGTFELNGLAPGDYTLRAMSNLGNPTGPDSESATLKITVTGEDIKDLQLVAVKPSLVRGRLIVDPAAAQRLQTTALAITMFPLEQQMMMMGGLVPGKVTDDFTFELRSAPGKYRVGSINMPQGFSIRAVRLGEADVTDSGFEIKPNEEVTGLEVELTNRITTIVGVVTNPRGEPSKDYSAIVFAQDSEQWTATSRYRSSGRPDQDGRYRIAGLPPGRYYIVAVDHLEPGQASDPEFLERIRGKATTFSLSEGETKSIDLKLNSSSM